MFKSLQDNNVETDDTNMLVSVLANTEKLKEAKDLYHYGDEVEHNDAEEKIDEYMEMPPQTNIPEDIRPQSYEQMPEEDKYAGSYINTQQDTQKEFGGKVDKTDPEEVDEYDTASNMRKKLLKLDLLRKMSELAEKGVMLTQNYNMDSDYKVMKYEYELHKKIREKHGTVVFLRDGCLSLIEGAETINKTGFFKKLGLELDGWSDKVNKKSNELYEVFGDLYENYGGSKRGIPPEMKLCGILGFSAVKTHMVNRELKKSRNMKEQIQTDRDRFESIRNQAMGETMRSQMDRQSPVWQEKLTKQYEETRKHVKDYEDLRNEEDEYEQIKMQNPMMPPSLMQQSNGIRDTEYMAMREQQDRMRSFTPNPNIMTERQFNEFRQAEIKEQQEKLEQRLDEQRRALSQRGDGMSYNSIRSGKSLKSMKSMKSMKSNDSDRSTRSTSSVVKMNPDYDKIIQEAEIMSNNAPKMPKKRGRKPKKDSVKIDI